MWLIDSAPIVFTAPAMSTPAVVLNMSVWSLISWCFLDLPGSNFVTYWLDGIIKSFQTTARNHVSNDRQMTWWLKCWGAVHCVIVSPGITQWVLTFAASGTYVTAPVWISETVRLLGLYEQTTGQELIPGFPDFRACFRSILLKHLLLLKKPLEGISSRCCGYLE